MARRLLLEGSDIDELLARVRAEHGPDAEIVHAQERLVGGVAGFFARRRYEVAVQVADDGVPVPHRTAATPQHRPEEQPMTPAAPDLGPLAGPIADALREAVVGGSFEDLLRGADALDGAGSAVSATSSGFAASASADGADGFRPAPYVPAAALPEPAQPAAASGVQPPAAVDFLAPGDTPGFDALLRDLLDRRELPDADVSSPATVQPARNPAATYRPWAPPGRDLAAGPAAPSGSWAPDATPEATPVAARDGIAEVTRHAIPEATPDATPDAAADLGYGVAGTHRPAAHREAGSGEPAPAALVALGLPPDTTVPTTSGDDRLVLLDLLADVATQPPGDLRGCAVIVGPAGPARAIAGRLLAETGLPHEALLVADVRDEDLVVADLLVGAAERCGRHGAAVVVLATGRSRADGRAAGRLAALLGSGPLTAVVDATRETEATRAWLAAIAQAGRSVDDLAAFDVAETSLPLRLLGLGHPVSWLDAVPATLGAWAGPCLDRLRP